MEQKYRIVVRTAGLAAETLRTLTMQLAGQPEIDLSAEQLARALERESLELASAIELDRARALCTIIGVAGGTAEILDQVGAVIGEQSAAPPLMPRGGAAGATMMGGFGPPKLADPAPAAPPPLDKISSVTEGDLLALDEASDSSGSTVPGQPGAKPAAGEPSPIGLEATTHAPASGPAAPAPASAPVKAEASASLDIGSLDASSLVLLDGSDESQPAPRPAPAPAAAPAPSAPPPASDDARFRPPGAEGGPPGAEMALELDMPPRPPTPAPPPPAETVAPLPMDDAVAAAPAPEEPLDRGFAEEPKTGPLRPHHARSARRRRMSLAVATGLRQAHVRVAVGFALALGLGSILPMCHARSVMSTTVEELRIELSTARAHGASATPKFSSVQQIEDRIASVRHRQAAYSFFLWLAGTGVLLFLWFRFV